MNAILEIISKAMPAPKPLLPLTLAISLASVPLHAATLTHYYPLDETTGTTVVDPVGGQDGTLINGTFDSLSAPGVIGQSLLLTDLAYVDLPVAALQFGTNSFSINLWAQRGVVDSGYRTLVQLQNTNSGNPGGVFARIQASTAKPANACRFTVDRGPANDDVYSTNVVLADGVFHMFTFVRDVVNTNSGHRIYIDGVLSGETDVGVCNVNGTLASLGVGHGGTSPWLPANYFVGPMDDVRIYSGVLSDADIAALYTNRQPPIVTPTPLTVTLDPVSQTNVLGGAITLTGGFTNDYGFLPFAYQWYRDSLPVSGATDTALTLPSLTFEDAGIYVLWATNIYGGLGTAPATLTVLFTNVSVVSGRALLTLQHVQVGYTQPVTPDSATDIANYVFEGNALTVSNVSMVNPTTIELLTSTQTPGSNYLLRISNVAGSSGTSTNVVPPGTQLPITTPNLVLSCVSYEAGTSASGPPDPESAAGGYWQPYWTGTSNLTVGPVTGDPDGLNAWQVVDFTTDTGARGYQARIPRISQDLARTNGWRLRTYCRFVDNNWSPTAALGLLYGDVGLGRRFFMAFTSDVGSDNNLKAVIYGYGGNPGTVTLTTDGFSGTAYHTHTIIYDPEVGAASYYFDNTLVISNWEGDDVRGYSGPTFGAFVSGGQGMMNYNTVQFDVVNGTNAVVLLNPQNTSVLVGNVAAFTAGFSPGFIGGYQWLSNNVVILGATNTTYTTPPTTFDMDGAQYACQVLSYEGLVQAQTAPATLTVTAARATITGFSVNGSTLTLTATGGTPAGQVVLLQSTDLALPLSQWTPVSTNAFDVSGNLQLSTDIIDPAKSLSFYVLKQ